MIFLPCTLPLVFVIIPLAMKQSPLKGLAMAVLFGLGLAITLSIYGAAVAWFGHYIGMNSIIRFMFGIAGAMAFVFGLSELKLLALRLPFMAKVLPTRLQKSGDYSKNTGLCLRPALLSMASFFLWAEQPRKNCGTNLPNYEPA